MSEDPWSEFRQPQEAERGQDDPWAAFRAKPQEVAPDAWDEFRKTAELPTVEPMPLLGQSLGNADVSGAAIEGIGSGAGDLRQSVEAIRGQPMTPRTESPLAQPLSMDDVRNPGQLAEKMAFKISKSSPMLGGGLIGGAAGNRLGAPAGTIGRTVGTIAGGAFGAGVTSAVQELGPYFAEALKNHPNDPDAAYQEAYDKARVSGAFAGAGWALFPVGAFMGPVKHVLFQALGVQPAVAVAGQATQNVMAGKPAEEGLGQAYVEGAAGTVVPMAGHAILNRAFRGPRPSTPEEVDAFLKEARGEQPNPYAWMHDPAWANQQARLEDQTGGRGREQAPQQPEAPEGPTNGDRGDIPKDLREYLDEVQRNPRNPAIKFPTEPLEAAIDEAVNPQKKTPRPEEQGRVAPQEAEKQTPAQEAPKGIEPLYALSGSQEFRNPVKRNPPIAAIHGMLERSLEAKGDGGEFPSSSLRYVLMKDGDYYTAPAHSHVHSDIFDSMGLTSDSAISAGFITKSPDGSVRVFGNHRTTDGRDRAEEWRQQLEERLNGQAKGNNQLYALSGFDDGYGNRAPKTPWVGWRAEHNRVADETFREQLDRYYDLRNKAKPLVKPQGKTDRVAPAESKELFSNLSEGEFRKRLHQDPQALRDFAQADPNFMEGVAFDPKIARRANEILEAVNRLDEPRMLHALSGFHHGPEKAVEDFPQPRAKPEQWRKLIESRPGWKDYVDWTELDKFLDGKKSISKDELLSYMRAHSADLDERVLQQAPPDLADRVGLLEEKSLEISRAMAEANRNQDAKLFRQLEGQLRQVVQELTPLQDKVAENRTKFEAHKIPGGEPGSYRELLIRDKSLGQTPEQRARVGEIDRRIDELLRLKHSDEGRAGGRALSNKISAELGSLDSEKIRLAPKYTSKHFQDQEIVFSQVDDRTLPDGGKGLLIHSIQGDNHQYARRVGGYGKEPWEKAVAKAEADGDADWLEELRKNGPAIDMPFKGDLWWQLMAKRLLRHAAENGYDALILPRSDQAEKAASALAGSLKTFYDEKIPKYLDKYVKKWGAKVEREAIPDLQPTQSDKPTLREENMLAAADMSEQFASDMDRRGMPQVAVDLRKFAEQARNYASGQGQIALRGIHPAAHSVIKDILAHLKEQEGTNPIIRITPQMRESVMGGQAYGIGDLGRRTNHVDLARSAIEAGQPYEVPGHISNAIMEAALPNYTHVPDDYHMVVVTGIEPAPNLIDTRNGKETKRVKVHIINPEGEEDSVLLDQRGFFGSRAITLPREGIILLSRLDMSPELLGTIGGEIHHEISHAIDFMHVLPSDVRSKLLSHSDALGVMSLPHKNFLLYVGDPAWKTSSDLPIWDLYADRYKDLSWDAWKWAMESEGIAHLREAYHHDRERLDPENLLARYGPVLNELEGFYNGEYTGRRGQVEAYTPANVLAAITGSRRSPWGFRLERKNVESLPSNYAEFNIHGNPGDYTGHLEGSVRPGDPTTFHIDNIFAPFSLGEPYAAGSNQLGASNIRDLLRQLRAHFPEIEKIAGNRISGARPTSEDVTVSIPKRGVQESRAKDGKPISDAERSDVLDQTQQGSEPQFALNGRHTFPERPLTHEEQSTVEAFRRSYLNRKVMSHPNHPVPLAIRRMISADIEHGSSSFQIAKRYGVSATWVRSAKSRGILNVASRHEQREGDNRLIQFSPEEEKLLSDFAAKRHAYGTQTVPNAIRVLIRRDYENGAYVSGIVERYGISAVTALRIKNGIEVGHGGSVAKLSPDEERRITDFRAGREERGTQGRGRVIPDDIHAMIRRDYAGGAPVIDIVARYGVSKSTVMDVVERERTKRELSPEQRGKIAAHLEYVDDDAAAAAKKFNASPEVVSRILDELNRNGGKLSSVSAQTAFRAAKREIEANNGGQPLFAITAYHGSPHDFEPEPGHPFGRFDINKVGTGEAVQGSHDIHGFYFGGPNNRGESTGKSYQIMTSTIKVDGKPIGAGKDWQGAFFLHQNRLNLDNAIKEVENHIRFANRLIKESQGKWPWSKPDERAIASQKRGLDSNVEALATLKSWKESGAKIEPNKGHLYEVDLDIEDSHTPDITAPFHAQTDEVKQAILGNPTLKAVLDQSNPNRLLYWTLYSRLEDMLGGGKAASRALIDAGIHAVKENDNGPNGMREGHFNYIVLDDSKIKITAKDGKPVSPQEREDVLSQTQTDNDASQKELEAKGHPLFALSGDGASSSETAQSPENTGSLPANKPRTRTEIKAYHVTVSPEIFSKFDPSKSKYRGEFYFSSRPEDTNYYIRGYSPATGRPRSIPAYIETKNFYSVNLRGKSWEAMDKYIEKAKAKGYDGLVATNVNDWGGNPRQTQYVVWGKDTVRSALSNGQPLYALSGGSGEPPSGKPPSNPGAIGPNDKLPQTRIGKHVSSIIDKMGIADTIRDFQVGVVPMSARDATIQAQAGAKDFANFMRLARYDGTKITAMLKREFTPAELEEMWNAADEESVARQQGKSTAGIGLAKLTPRQRTTVEALQERAHEVWEAANAVGMVDSEGLPSYVPRMFVSLADDVAAPLSSGGKNAGLGRPLKPIGGNVKTSTPNTRQRKHLEAEDSEAAAQTIDPNARLVRDIRALPLATARLQEAVAGRALINQIKQIGKVALDDTVVEGGVPTNTVHSWFTIPQSQAFWTYRPKMVLDKQGHPVMNRATNHPEYVKDAEGNTVMERVPLYVRSDYEGPLKAVLSRDQGAVYNALMKIKMNSVGLIMYSPAIHYMVEIGRSTPAFPFKVLTGRIQADGFRAKHNPEVMREAIVHGLVPIGGYGARMEISSMVNEANAKPGENWFSNAAGFVPGLFDPRAGDAVKRTIDRASNIWHNTLLWDRIASLQMGLYTNFLDSLLKKGLQPSTAKRMAAHLANRYAGALPQEAMSSMARKIANIMLFSRTFTLGNMGVLKDMISGLPSDVQAQIAHDAGFKELSKANSVTKRKSWSVFLIDVALFYASISVLQNIINILLKDKSIGDEAEDYLKRLKKVGEKVSSGKMQNPFSMLEGLSATSENEPDKKDKVHLWNDTEGKGIYARIPVGKIGEEFKNYFTQPIKTFNNKLSSALIRPTKEMLANDKGFGRKVYDPNATEPDELLKNGAKIAWNYMRDAVPADSVEALYRLGMGKGNEASRNTEMFKVLGPLVGLTFSTGAPGGPAMGDIYAEKTAYEYRLNEALPSIRDMIKEDKEDDARAKMTEIGVPRGYQNYIVKTTKNPQLRLSPKKVREFKQRANPEQLEDFERHRANP